jgi:hypothetical protein
MSALSNSPWYGSKFLRHSILWALERELLAWAGAGELFLTDSSVGVYRLIDVRWRAFAPDEQQDLEQRIAEGAQADWFREDHAERVERCRFDLLGHLERGGVQTGNRFTASRSSWVLELLRVPIPHHHRPLPESAGVSTTTVSRRRSTVDGVSHGGRK